MRSSRNPTGLSWLAAWLALVSAAYAFTAQAQINPAGHAKAASAKPPVITSASAENWAALPPGQRQILAPLAAQWSSLDETSRDKWITVANRYPKLSPDAQKKIQERMTQWVKVPPQQRGEARLRFQNSRQISPQERQQKWAAYQALSPERREELAHQALRKQRPVVMAASEAGPREQGQASSRQHARNGWRKSNLVPGDSGTSPKAVAPTLIKAGPGATTSLVTQAATPPLHQHTGLPKISSGTVFIDPQTMLPRKGSQGAAMTPVTAASSPPATH